MQVFYALYALIGVIVGVAAVVVIGIHPDAKTPPEKIANVVFLIVLGVLFGALWPIVLAFWLAGRVAR